MEPAQPCQQLDHSMPVDDGKTSLMHILKAEHSRCSQQAYCGDCPPLVHMCLAAQDHAQVLHVRKSIHRFAQLRPPNPIHLPAGKAQCSPCVHV